MFVWFFAWLAFATWQFSHDRKIFGEFDGSVEGITFFVLFTLLTAMLWPISGLIFGTINLIMLIVSVMKRRARSKPEESEPSFETIDYRNAKKRT